ncbi:MAG TPA: GNAT family N-acetyltransferase [Anaerolineales bacterium]
MAHNIRPSFTIREYQDSDISPLLAVIRAAARLDSEPFLLTEAAFRDRLNSPGLDPCQDVFIAEVPGLGPVGYAEGQFIGDGNQLFYRTRGSVHPDCRRQGIGRALLECLWQRAQTLSSYARNRPVTLASRALTSQPGAIALFESFSMRPVRHFLELSRDLTAPLPELRPPPGILLQRWCDRRSYRAVWSALNEAFSDHWNPIPESFKVFEHHIRSKVFDLKHSWIAWDGEQVAGGALNRIGPETAALRDQNQGYVNQLFVRRPWRRQGIGTALLVATMEDARQAGHISLGLNVDANNLSGAVQFYESIDFYHSREWIMYQRS